MYIFACLDRNILIFCLIASTQFHKSTFLIRQVIAIDDFSNFRSFKWCNQGKQQKIDEKSIISLLLNIE